MTQETIVAKTQEALGKVVTLSPVVGQGHAVKIGSRRIYAVRESGKDKVWTHFRNPACKGIAESMHLKVTTAIHKQAYTYTCIMSDTEYEAFLTALAEALKKPEEPKPEAKAEEPKPEEPSKNQKPKNQQPAAKK